ncbi:MAG TPA: patatin-like phospholipase family protein [Candidatus Lustribacter sp.]|nr:patatin-like phospholipase family protein [Candidatus Lustribacter sp.]
MPAARHRPGVGRVAGRRPLVDLRSLVEVVYTVHAPMDLRSILDSAVPWHPLATCVETGAAVDLRPYLRQADDVQVAIRASAAMPVLAGGPIGLGGRHFYDGGVAEPIPYRTAMGQGATHVLVLRSRRRDDIPKVSRTTPLFARAALRRYSHELERAYNHGPVRHAEDDARLDGMTPNAAAGVALASIRPAPGSPRVGRLASDGGLLGEAFEAGRAAVHEVFARMPGRTDATGCGPFALGSRT